MQLVNKVWYDSSAMKVDFSEQSYQENINHMLKKDAFKLSSHKHKINHIYNIAEDSMLTY